MFQPAALFIGLRYSRSRQGSAFTRFIQRFSLIGIMIGVAALIVVTSVMNGFENELKNRILGVVPQVTVQGTDGAPLEDWQATQQDLVYSRQVRHSAPFVQVESLLQGRGQLSAVMLQGLYPEYESAYNQVTQHMVRGQFSDLQAGEFGVILGRPLAYQLDVQVGEQVRLVAASGGQFTPAGVMPAQRMFRVIGLFEVGADIDRQLAIAHADDVARLLRYPQGAVGGIRLYLDDAFAAQRVASHLRQQISPQQSLQVTEWSERYGRLFDAVRMEKGMMLFMLAMVVMVAAFNVVSALVMVIHDKRYDIAILQTLGLSRGQVYAMLMVQGAASGLTGALVGVVLGIALTFGLNPIMNLLGLQIMLYTDGQGLPFLMHVSQVAAIAGLAVALTLMATLYPAWRASRVQPAQALRYE